MKSLEHFLDLECIYMPMICDECGTKEALDAAGLTEGSSIRKSILACVGRGSTPQERAEAKIRATGNKWAMENFRDTHN